MEAMILKFAASARAAGLRVSTAEVLDCLDQLSMVDILDEAQFATLLRAHFAKSRLEQSRFDQLYHLFFHELQEDLSPASLALAEQMDRFRESLHPLEEELPAMPAIADFLANQPEGYLQLLHEMESEGPADPLANRGLGANAGGLVRRLQVMQAIQGAGAMLERYLAAYRDSVHWETRAAFRRLVEHRLNTVRRMLSENNLPAVVPEKRQGPVADIYGELGQRSFASLTPGEMMRMRDAINDLVRKLRDQVSRRQAARARGVVDLKRTLRAAARTQGIPLQIKYRQKPPRKARVVVLCDVSGSVWSSARFMLTMLYALQDCFDRVKSFVFVDEPIEVTHYFDDFDIARALAEILESPDIIFGASTDYGRTLRFFKQRHMQTITQKTTVIVIGDGRSNYGNPEEGILEELRDRGRRLFWLNPETRRFWYSGDSEMRTYETLCNEVHHCQNLNQLAAFVRDLVL